MPYIESDSITVFPAVKRAQDYQKDARLLTEESVTRIQRLLNSSFDDTQAEHQGFVISTMEEINDSVNNPNHYVEFIIGGYYVKVKVGDMGAGNGSTVWAFINVTQQGGYSELGGVDSSDKFTGVFFANIATQQTFSPYTHSLKILTVKGDFSTTQEVKEVFNRREGYSEDIVCSSLTTTGSGGIKVKDGASDKITLSQNGSVDAVGNISAGGTISSTGAITAGGGITSSGDISGVNIAASGDITVSGAINGVEIRESEFVYASPQSRIDLGSQSTYNQHSHSWLVLPSPNVPGYNLGECFSNAGEVFDYYENVTGWGVFIANSSPSTANGLDYYIQEISICNISSDAFPTKMQVWRRVILDAPAVQLLHSWTLIGGYVKLSGDLESYDGGTTLQTVGRYTFTRSGNVVTLVISKTQNMTSAATVNWPNNLPRPISTQSFAVPVEIGSTVSFAEIIIPHASEGIAVRGTSMALAWNVLSSDVVISYICG